MAIVINSVNVRFRAARKVQTCGCQRQKAAENRERILTEAARLFREHGLSGVGVDALTEAAGLTHGSLYSQFGSKHHLAAEAVGHALDTSAARMGDAMTLDDYLARYLSADHRERRGDGCVMAALAGEIPRQGAVIRHSFTNARAGGHETDCRSDARPPEVGGRGAGHGRDNGRRTDIGARCRRSGPVMTEFWLPTA